MLLAFPEGGKCGGSTGAKLLHAAEQLQAATVQLQRSAATAASTRRWADDWDAGEEEEAAQQQLHEVEASCAISPELAQTVLQFKVKK